MQNVDKTEKTEIYNRYVASLSPTGRKQYPAVAKRVLFGFKMDGHKFPAIEFDRPGVEKLIKAMRDYGYSDGSIDFYWRVIRRLFKVAGKPWPFERHDNPVINELNVMALALPFETIRKMVQAHHEGKLSIHESYFLALSTIYGLRDHEIAGLTPAHFDLRQRAVYVETAKHGRQRYHLIPEETFPIFQELVPHLPPTNRHRVIKGFHGIEKKAGIVHTPYTGFHSIRRSLDHFLFKAGLDQPSIKMFMRWKRDKSDMSMGYAEVRFAGEDGGYVSMSSSDTEQDKQVFKVHPFLPLWRV